MKEKWFSSIKIVFALGLALGLLWVSIALAAPGDIERISDFDDDAYHASISGDGRYVAFKTNVGPGYNFKVFVFDRQEGTETEIDEGGNHIYEDPAISANGEWLAYLFNFGEIHILEWQEDFTPEYIIYPPVAGTNWYGFYDFTISEDGCRVGYSFVYEKPEDTYFDDVYLYDCNENKSILISKEYNTDDRANGDSGYASLSDDGLVFAFSSYATNLVDTNPPTDGRRHVYVRDLVAGVTKRIMLPSEWEAKDAGKTHGISLSADGCHAALEYNYEVAGEEYYDVFLYDCITEETVLISIFNGLPSGNSDKPSISGDGRFITFSKVINGDEQIFFYDAETGNIKLVSKALNGNPGNAFSYNSVFSADGRFIAFESWASNLVAGDTNNVMDVFVYEVDLSTGYNIFLPLIRR